MDKTAESFSICRDQLAPLNVYDEVFITKEAASDLVDSETVLIICDTNNQRIYESTELISTVKSIAVLDHHRLASPLAFDPFLQYIEATKSSASEIVSEILMRSKYHEKLHKEEAEVLLSGIMLDTHNFTRNAGAQTFEITHYLYSRGAHTSVVREFFNQELEDMRIASAFDSMARIYRDVVAITWLSTSKEPTPEDRVAASKAADSLLSLKGIEASFAMVLMNDTVAISGRS
jgi:c-di-AMP phosphodiesterase-like protein